MNKKKCIEWDSNYNIKGMLYNVYDKEKDVRDEDKRIYMNKNGHIYVFKHIFFIFYVISSCSKLLFINFINFGRNKYINGVKEDNRIYRKELYKWISKIIYGRCNRGRIYGDVNKIKRPNRSANKDEVWNE